jgi:hypothetical protein
MKPVALSVLSVVLFIGLLVTGYFAFSQFQERETVSKERKTLGENVMKWEFIQDRLNGLKSELLKKCTEEFPMIENAEVVGYADKIEVRLFTEQREWPVGRYNKISDRLKQVVQEYFSFPTVVVGIFDMQEELIIKRDVAIVGSEGKTEEAQPTEESQSPSEGEGTEEG